MAIFGMNSDGSAERMAATEILSIARQFPRIIPLTSDSILARTNFGSYLAVPMCNIDVVPGIVRDGEIEPHTTAVARSFARPGMNIINAGANFGYYTILYASLLNRQGFVYSIEANGYIIPYLMRTIYWSGYPETVRLFYAAVSDISGVTQEIAFDPQFSGGGGIFSSGKITAEVADWREGLWENADLASDFNSNGEWVKGRSHYAVSKVQSRTLDDICDEADKIDLLHMDIEGLEAKALAGASKIISRSPDIAMIVEWSPYYANHATNKDLCQKVMGNLFLNGFKFFRIRTDIWSDNRSLPKLTPIPNLETLFAEPFCDIVICRNLAVAARSVTFELQP